MEKRRFRRNESGAVLLTVLCIMTVMIVLVGAAITFVNQTTQKTYKTFQAEQSYMTASTCLESFVQQIENDTNSATNTDKDSQQKAIQYLEQLASENGGKGYEYDVLINNNKDIEKMGSCTIKVSRYNANTIVITSTAKFGKESDQVAAYVYTETVPKKATFTNAIELCQDNDMEYNNLNVLGDMATLRGDNKSKNYTMTNQFKVYGSSYIYGNVLAKGGGDSKTNFLMPNRTDSTMGSFVTISGNFTTNNDYRMKTTVDWGLGYNYLNIGETFTVGDSGPQIGGQVDFDTPSSPAGAGANSLKDIDIFCHNAVFNGGKYRQQGNLCVYRNDGEEGNNGNLTIQNANGIEIWGDVYVDGDILMAGGDAASLVVHGKIQYCGSIKSASVNVKTPGYWDSSIPPYGAWVPDVTETVVGPAVTHANGATEVTVSGNMKVKATDGISKVSSINKDGRTKRPAIESSLMEYIVFPEDYLFSTDSDTGLLKNEYEAFYNGTCTTTLTDIINAKGSGDVVYTDENGVVSKYKCVIDKNCTIDTNDFAKAKATGSTQGGGSKILIHITDKDIVIRLKDGASADRNVNFIVKNDSTNEHPHFCYFVPDAGLDFTQDTTKKGTTKTSWTNNNAATNKTYRFENSTWMDYYTYVNMFNDSVLASSATTLVDGSPAFRDGFVLNSTGEEVLGTYTPRDASTFLLFTQNNTLDLYNATFMEAIFYGPDATFLTATQGINGVPVHTADGDRAWKICSLGMIIAGGFKNSNESAYLFKKPAEGGVLDIAKGARTDNLYGYKLLRYDHH